MKPYEEIRQSNEIVRTFDQDIDNHELVWHRDKCDREVRVIECKDWLFQFDDKLPFLLKEGMEFFIPKETFHRIIKGKGSLTIKIFEY